jgi:ATP-binding cassette, subfamily F, member 3
VQSKEATAIEQAKPKTKPAYNAPQTKDDQLKKKEQEKQQRKIEKQIGETEAMISRLEKEISDVEAKLKDVSFFNGLAHNDPIFSNYEQKKLELQEMMTTWEALQVSLESIQA